MGESDRQLGVERGDELAARGGRCVGHARAADEDNAGGKCVGTTANIASYEFRSYWPGAADVEVGSDYGIKESVPASAGGSLLAAALRLLKGVVDGDRKRRVGLLCDAAHGLAHTVEEEDLRLLLAAMSVRRCNQFLGFGHGERSEKVGEDGLQRVAQPHVEEVREVGVTNIVIVGWIGGDNSVRAE
jgi:hypothetical protein